MAIGIAGELGAAGRSGRANDSKQPATAEPSPSHSADKAVTGRATHLDAEPVAEDVVDVLRDGERVLAVQGVDVGHLLLKEGGKRRG